MIKSVHIVCFQHSLSICEGFGGLGGKSNKKYLWSNLYSSVT